MPKLKVGYDGNAVQAKHDFEAKYGREPPKWMVDNRRAPWAWEKVTEVAGSMGLFREPGPDPLDPTVPDNHRSEVFENELDYMTPVAAELVTEMLGGEEIVSREPLRLGILVGEELSGESLYFTLDRAGDVHSINRISA